MFLFQEVLVLLTPDDLMGQVPVVLDDMFRSEVPLVVAGIAHSGSLVCLHVSPPGTVFPTLWADSGDNVTRFEMVCHVDCERTVVAQAWNCFLCLEWGEQQFDAGRNYVTLATQTHDLGVKSPSLIWRSQRCSQIRSR